MDELLAQFLVEAPELLEQADDALLALERAPADSARLNDAFRAVHTLKGSVGLFDLPALERLLHAAEDTLSSLREGRRAVDAEVIRALLAVLDQTETWIGPLAESGTLPADATTRALALMRLLPEGPEHAAPAVSSQTPDWAGRPVRPGPSRPAGFPARPRARLQTRPR